MANVHVHTGPHPLELAEAIAFVSAPDAGGTVLFSGTVRSPNDGAEVDHLDYEVWEGRVDTHLRELAQRAIEHSGAHRVWIAHRTGRVDVSEPSVVVAVSAAHRAEAFDACRWLIDELKATAPIWKREVTTDGSAWVGLGGEAS